MVEDLERRINELRFLEGIEKVEHVTYPDRDELWIRFKRPMDLRKLAHILRVRHYELEKFGAIPSKLPLRLGELLWDGVAYVIVRQIGFFRLLAAFFGSEPEGIARIVKVLHSSQPIFIARDEEGVKILYVYLGVNYTSPMSNPLAKQTVARTIRAG